MTTKNTLPNVTDQIREHIENCGMTRYRISKLTGISESALTKFMSGERGLSATAIDTLGKAIGFKVEMPCCYYLQRTGDDIPENSSIPNPHCKQTRSGPVLVVFSTKQKAIDWARDENLKYKPYLISTGLLGSIFRGPGKPRVVVDPTDGQNTTQELNEFLHSITKGA